MGTTKTTNTTTTTPTEAEKQMQELQLQQYKATQPYQQETQISGLQLANNLLTGGKLPEGYQELWGGIGQDQTNAMIQQSLRSMMPQFQSQGLMDSGTMIQAGARTAGDIQSQNAQFNLGQKLNLLNLAVGGQAQIQSPVQGSTNLLANQLAGLRTTTQTTKNPFLTGSDIMTGIGTGIGTFAGLNLRR